MLENVRANVLKATMIISRLYNFLIRSYNYGTLKKLVLMYLSKQKVKRPCARHYKYRKRIKRTYRRLKARMVKERFVKKMP